MSEDLQQDQEKTELFEKAPVPHAVMTMAIPTIMSSLVMIIYNLADTFFVGILGDPVQNAAVTLAAPVILAFNAVNNLFGVGGSSLMSRCLGVREYDTVRKTSAVSFYCALLCAVLFAAACGTFHNGLLNILGADTETVADTWKYLRWTAVCGAVPAILNVVMANLVRSEGSALHASIGTMSGCVLNIILDPFFILPRFLNMGAAGAGLATFLSNSAACIYFFILLWVRRKKTFVCLNPKMFCLNRRIFSEIFKVGIPAAIQNLLNVTGTTILNNFTSAYGANAVAAMGISQKLNMIPMYVALGISQGTMPLVGYNYTNGNHTRMRKIILFAAKISLSFLFCMTIIYLIGAKGLITLFMRNEEVVAYGTRLIRGMCLGNVFLATDFLTVGVFQACGMGGRALIFAILRKIVLEIPAMIILNMIWPLYGLAYAQPLAEFVLSIVAVILLYRILKPDRENKVSQTHM